MKFPVRLLIPALAIVLTAGAAALLFSPPAQAQTPDADDCTANNQLCVTEIAFTSSGPYKEGAAIKVTVTFSGHAVAEDAGTSTIELAMYDPTAMSTTTYSAGDTATHHLLLATANPTTAPEDPEEGTSLEFTYTVRADDPDGGIVTVPLNTLSVTTGLGTQLLPVDTNLTLNPAHDRLSAHDVANHHIDKTAPTLNSVTVDSSGTLDVGGTITVTVTFDEKVKVEGEPTLKFQIGGQERTATYSSGAGTDKLVFTYPVAKHDNGDVSLPAGSFSGTITDLAGNAPANKEHPAGTVVAGSNVMTDVTAPTVKYRAPNSLTVGIRIRTIRPTSDDADVTYKIKDGKLPRGLRFDEDTGYITGRPSRAVGGPTRLTIEVCDKAAGEPNCVDVKLTLPAILEDEEETAVDQTPTLPEVPEVDLSSVTVGDAAPSTALQIALAAAGGALLLGGVSLVAVRRRARR